MSETLYTMINKAKDKDKYSLELLILKFEPIINKLSRQLNYDCAKSDLIIFFIKFLENINLNSISLNNEGSLVNYIKISFYREYYKLSSKNCSPYESEFIDNMYSPDLNYNEVDFNMFLSQLLSQKVINKKQMQILKLKCLYSFNDKYIADVFNISRQAVNKNYRLSIKLIKNYLEKGDSKK